MVQSDINTIDKILDNVWIKHISTTHCHLESVSGKIFIIPLNNNEIYKVDFNDLPEAIKIIKNAFRKYLSTLNNKEIEKIWFELT